MDYSKIQKLIDSSDIVSFDVFDTLITRQVLHPADVFSLTDIIAKQMLSIEFNFRNARTEAEKELIDSDKKFCYNLSDIHRIIKKRFRLSDELSKKLLDIELESEERVTCARKDVLELFLSLHNTGKKIILVSDMYLSSDQIKHLLIKCGYPVDVELFVSNEYGKVKSDGSLWKEIADTFKGKKIVHIGDNKLSDFVAVKKIGQKSVLINNPVESFFCTKLYKLLGKYDTGEFGNSLILGKLCNEILFNNAFSSDYDYNALTGIWTGAALACFMRWLIKNRDDSLLLFVTRECYIFQPMYLEYCKIAGIEPQKNTRFYTSRQAASIASVTSLDDLKDLLEIEYEGTIENFILTRCGYKCEKDELKETVRLPKDKEAVLEKIKDIIDDIIAISVPRKLAYVNYIDQCCKNAGCKEATIVDIGYRGTTQYLLSKICGKKIGGKYFIADNIVYPEKIDCEVKYLSSRKNGLHPIYDNISFFEGILQVPYGQLLELSQNEDGKFEMTFNNAKQTAPEIISAQSDFFEYAKSDAEWYAYTKGEFDYSLDLAEDLWMGLAYYNFLPDGLFGSLSLDDEFNGLDKWSYNPKKHRMENKSFSIPFIFYGNRAGQSFKESIKTIVKKYSPAFIYQPLKLFWLKFIK